jgi:hypothetical protein
MLLYTVSGSMTAPGFAASSPSDHDEAIADCEKWEQRPNNANSADNPCSPQRAFQAEEELSDLSNEQEKGDLRWQPLEPHDRDFSLWYYPGAPRPLWGY